MSKLYSHQAGMTTYCHVTVISVIEGDAGLGKCTLNYVIQVTARLG